MKKLLLWLFVLAAVALAGAYLARNMIVASAITNGSTYAMGVETHLGSANLSLTAGNLGLNGYKIDNPDGFESDQFMSIESGMLDINTGSVFADTVEIDSLILEQVKVTLEYNNGKSNYQTLMDNATNVLSERSSSSTNLRIRKVAISKIRVEAKVTLPGNNRIEEAFEINNIVLNDVGDNTNASMAKVIATIIQKIVKKALAESRHKLPGDVGKYFEGIGKGTLEKVGADAVDKVKDIGSSLLGGDKKK